jgi:hypothetical protein
MELLQVVRESELQAYRVRTLAPLRHLVVDPVRRWTRPAPRFAALTGARTAATAAALTANARARRRVLGRRRRPDGRHGHGCRDRARLPRVLRRRVGADDGGDDAAGRRTGRREELSQPPSCAGGAIVRRLVPRRVDAPPPRRLCALPSARVDGRRCLASTTISPSPEARAARRCRRRPARARYRRTRNADRGRAGRGSGSHRTDVTRHRPVYPRREGEGR